MKRRLTELVEYRESFTPTKPRKAVADALGVSEVTVWRWENGEREPDRQDILRIAELIGKPAAQIAGLA